MALRSLRNVDVAFGDETGLHLIAERCFDLVKGLIPRF